jgi:hypothetical protein
VNVSLAVRLVITVVFGAHLLGWIVDAWVLPDTWSQYATLSDMGRLRVSIFCGFELLSLAVTWR